MCAIPNIFDFATSELSQDAFICWLVSWVDCDEDPVMQDCAKDFVALLYGLGREESVDRGAVSKIENLQQQYCHTDIYFQATIAGKKVSFIIEDKTHTTHHSGQLERYLKEIRGDGVLEDEVVAVYFKTGYLHTWDRMAEDHGYRILDYRIMHDFLDAHPADNVIFENYREFFRKTYYEPYTTDYPRFLEGADLDLLRHWYVQWEYMKELQSTLADLQRPTVDVAIDGPSCVYGGKNRDGSPWTELKFVWMPEMYGGIGETLFYRLDRRKEGYYLGVRQYAEVKQDQDAKRQKVERLTAYKNLFQRLRPGDGLHGLTFGKPVSDHSGNNESEIAVLFLCEGSNTPKLVLDHIPRIHAEFVSRIRQSDLLLRPAAGSA